MTTLLFGFTLIFAPGRSSTIFKNDQFDAVPPTSLFFDAKQRMLVAKTRPPTADDPVERLIVCLEPSPDALVAASASFGAALDLPEKVGLRLAEALQEQAGQVGLKTHTVTLLRDGLSRSCEAYSNGIIGREEYEQILNGYGSLVLTMMAIEQASGVQSTFTTVLAPGRATATASSEVGKAPAAGEEASAPSSPPQGSASADAGDSRRHTVQTAAVPPANAVVGRQLAGAYLLDQIGAEAAFTSVFNNPKFQEMLDKAMDLLLSNNLPSSGVEFER